MKVCLVQWSTGAALMLAVLAALPAKAAEQTETMVSEELNSRTKAPASSSEDNDGLSDSAVRVMSSYAISILPDSVAMPGGATVQLDKRDPKKFFIPLDDARMVIRAAMRSTYAQVCDLPDLEQQNYVALMEGEQNRNVWSFEQLQFIDALYSFSVSYFTGTLKFEEKAPAGEGSGDAAAKASPSEDEGFKPKRPSCTAEKKQNVIEAINQFVTSVRAAQAPVAEPIAPETAGAN
ncbi:hypothetical protein V6C03_09835 [Methyloligella sp. 2.7D]|uniref:hypothetical protein n=1 Tax=unclassified Methyloligella TaxID=2625955 RepID=UPI00157E29C5|nr:hypothetical protein [Methyloligella sp. GL2]QKP77854.1 hypothetical protein HT051_10620 [Methyloligella sp. GL2]